MKYDISITGGFLGRSSAYSGQVPLQEPQRKKLLDSIQDPIAPKKQRLRDGFTYTVRLIDEQDGDKIYNLEFDDLNIPTEVRMFIDAILKKE